MNEFLADLYGTNEIIGSDEQDLEKDAAANFLIKIAEEQNVDLSECSDDEIAELYAAVEGEMQKEASDEGEIDDEAQTKLAEADFLGRAMAHAYVAELDDIEKQAGRMTDIAGKGKEIAGKVLSAIKGGATKVKDAPWTGRQGRKLQRAKSQAGEALSGWSAPGRSGGSSKLSLKERLGRAAGAAGDVPGAKGTALLAGGAGAAKLMSGKEKKSFDEQFEDAAVDRANAMLEQAGLLDQEKVAEAQLEEALNERAAELLIEAGYEFTE